MSKINMPQNLRSSSLGNLAKSAMTRKADLADEVMYVDPEECYVVINPRKSFNMAMVEEYTAQFLDPQQGQREPCTVYPKDAKGYRIHHGATRTLAGKAAKKINPDWKLKIIIDPALNERSELANYWEQGANNILRDNMTLFDQADWMANCQKLAEAEGNPITQTEIAKRLVMSKAQVSRIMSLRNATTEIRDLYVSGRTQDPETLSNLIKIQANDPELFKTLLDTTELERAIVRQAAKTGQLPVEKEKSQSEIGKQEPTESKDKVTPNETEKPEQPIIKERTGIDYFVAHAQQRPLQGIELISGECLLLTLKTDKGYQAAAKTNFAHDYNLTPSGSQINTWAEEADAVRQAYQSLISWSYKVEQHADEVTEDQLEDARMVRDWLKLQNDPSSVEEKSEKREENQKPNLKKRIITTGVWNGQECTLVTSLDSKMLVKHGNIIEEAEAEGLVYVRLPDGELKKIQPDEFHLKSVKLTD